MMISSTSNPEIKRIVKLKNRKYRDESNQFVIEGVHLLEMALRADVSVHWIYCTDLFSAGTAGKVILETANELEIPVTFVSEQVLKKISDTETPQGVLGIANMVPTLDWQKHLQSGPVVVVDRIQDPGNLGTIVRTADSAGADGILLLNGTVDMYNSKTVRSSMGSVFNVPFAQNIPFLQAYEQLKNLGYTLVAADIHGAKVYHAAQFPKKTALVVGNEGQGLAQDIRQHVDVSVKIPMLGKAESLNVAVACGIILYEIIRQNTDDECGEVVQRL
jgi:RNA methyltransferase, TrmH family